MAEMNDLLVTAIRGHYSPEDEDRLTQVFATCFNHSSLFRRAALGFFGFRESSTMQAVTQRTSLDGKGRLDILISDADGRSFGVIENKIDSPLTGRQLRNYEKAGHRDIVAITRALPETDANLSRFNVFRWADFYSALEKTKGGWSRADELLVGGFLQYLKELDMMGLQETRRGDLAKACTAISTLAKPPERYLYRSFARGNPFLIFGELFKYFERVHDEANKDPFLRSRIGKNFRFNPGLEFVEGFKSPMVGFQFYNPWRGRSRKIVSAGLYYLIHPTDRKQRGFYVWRLYKNRSRDYIEKKIDSHVFQGDVLSVDKLCATALKHWKQWID